MNNDDDNHDIVVVAHDDASMFYHPKKKKKAVNIGESRIGTCPVCNKAVHRALLPEHVDFCLTGKYRVTNEEAKAKERMFRDTTNYYEPHVASNSSSNNINNDNIKEKKKPTFSILKFLQKKKQREEKKSNNDDIETTTTTTNNNNNNISINDSRENEEEDGEEVDLIAINTRIEGGKIPDKVLYPLNTMSGNYSECGICLKPFDEENGVVRYLFYPCMHARQCKDCAIRVWQTKKIRGKYKTNRTAQCCWCSQKIEVRPRPFCPFL